MPLTLSKAEISSLRILCAKAESAGELTPAILKIIYSGKWFKLFVPAALGGLALDLPNALKYQEALAYIDGSLGWTVTLCAGASFFVGYIEPTAAKPIFSRRDVCWGGSGAASGVAQKIKGGYKVSGRWKYATGTPHLTHFTANCVVKEKGKLVLKKDGTPLVRSFFFEKKEVTVHNEWNTMGLKATAGHGFSVQNLLVAEENSFVIDETNPTLEEVIFKYPFLSFAEATLAVNIVGMTRHFFDEGAVCMEERKLSGKSDETLYRRGLSEINTARDAVEKLYAQFYEAVAISWEELPGQGAVSIKSRKAIARLSRRLVKQCRQSVTDIMPYTGLMAARETSEINRIFRDIFTGSQHSLLTV